jgi:hypothetical protein
MIPLGPFARTALIRAVAVGTTVVVLVWAFGVRGGGAAVLSGTGVGALTGSGAERGSSPQPAPPEKGSFRIAGSAHGLYPGFTGFLVLTVTSPEHFPIKVTSLNVAVADASPLCKASNIHVSPFAGSLVVPANGSASTQLTIQLAHAAPDACQGVLFPLSYTGTASKA